MLWNFFSQLNHSHLTSIKSSHVGSSIIPVDGVGRISYCHCLYYASQFCSITCIFFHPSIFLHLILYLLFPCLFQSSSSSTTSHFKFLLTAHFLYYCSLQIKISLKVFRQAMMSCKRIKAVQKLKKRTNLGWKNDFNFFFFELCEAHNF